MNAKRNRLIREQVEDKLASLHPLKKVGIPRKGWIRAIRDALGISGTQLGKRLGCTRQWISLIENNEIDGNVTLNTMRRVAEGLDCEFVYGFVPKTSLEDTITRQIHKVAEARIKRISQTMRLEQQHLNPDEEKKMLEREVDLVMADSTNAWWQEW